MERSHILYWIWLSLCFVPGSRNADLLLEHFGENAKSIFEADDAEYDRLDLTESVKKRLRSKDSAEAKRIYYWCREHGVRLLAYDDPAFPDRLRHIAHRPVLLYASGREIDLNNNLMIAMVGTRRISSYGSRTAYAISYDLARAGAVVVSGMALGVDAVCHGAALDAMGDTVAILGCGIDIAYPKQNLDLMLALEKKGLILTEYKPGMHPTRESFPARNRLISGISQGTLVVEADAQSGAMITARHAKEQGRDLFALPGMVGEQNSEGTNSLLLEGAHPVTSAFDLLNGYAQLYPDRIFVERIPVYRPQIRLTGVKGAAKVREEVVRVEPPAKKTVLQRAAEENAKPSPRKREEERRDERKTDDPPFRGQPSGLNEQESAVYRALSSAAEPLSTDQIVTCTGLSTSDVMSALTMMEIGGVVTSLPGGRFVL